MAKILSLGVVIGAMVVLVVGCSKPKSPTSPDDPITGGGIVLLDLTTSVSGNLVEVNIFFRAPAGTPIRGQIDVFSPAGELVISKVLNGTAGGFPKESGGLAFPTFVSGDYLVDGHIEGATPPMLSSGFHIP